MTIRRILMQDRTSRKRRLPGFVLGAILIFLMGGTIAELPAEEATVPPPPQVSEARRYYDSVTWHDVVSSGPNRVGYSMVVIHEMPAQAGEGKTFAIVTPQQPKE